MPTPDEILALLPADAPEDLAQLVRDWPLCYYFDDIPTEAAIVVVGAYKGKAVDLLSRMFPTADVFGFEPQEWALQEAMARMAGRPTVSLINVGLGFEARTAAMGEWHTDAASFANTGPATREQGSGIIVRAERGLEAGCGLDHVDLMIVNIEGGEYELLPTLRESGWLKHIDRLAVQWHLNLAGPFLSWVTPDMDRHIAALAEDSFTLRMDERPTWTYHVKESI